ncbi:dolichyl-phosphate-mannose-protein mannosyltransferase [Chitinophaga skermanii]|uniref:Dolichyl-phosphate-mannose-protein mannosyltransferase n=1 Tax=Chitinophaga skermanii TaxID=331697 RepID=A0A327R3B5_9BACT|nr:glycosyltransferase family 39 protein [Chitinophaga skermanii]RAJ10452.1 dolichyl-phosphate-mannose-protein mannosyltransferase [Chitinophaga skermanii]
MNDIVRFFKKDQYKNLFFLAWAVLGILQACFTELMDDEAYYWVYSQHLDWGYFDHPPMIAVLIKIGYSLFHNELGVRLMMVLLNVGTLVLLDKLIPTKNNKVLYLILGAMGAMQLGGMLAVPDLPLIFFATLYFYAYKKFLSSQDWKHTIFLAITMALMFYSKYHGVLLVFFTLVSNFSLLKVRQYYMAVLITTLLFLPHIYWQYAHHFPSLQYHLVERNASAYKLNFSLDYIAGQVLMFGPLVGWLLLYYGFRCPIQNAFERAMKFSLIGVLVFFLISTFKGRVEANWTVMVFTPLVVLAHQAIVRLNYSLKPLLYTLPVTLLLVIIVRVYMMWDFVPNLRVRPELHHNHEWTSAIKKVAGDKPVVFFNTYQSPSKYMFYTGEKAYSLNSVYSRRSQYNYWHMEEDDLWGKDVLMASRNIYDFMVRDSIMGPGETIFDRPVVLKTIDHKPDSIPSQEKGKYWYVKHQNPYYSYSLIQFDSNTKEFYGQQNEIVNMRAKVLNGYKKPVQYDPNDTVYVAFSFADRTGRPVNLKTTITLQEALTKDSIDIPLRFPHVIGRYKVKMTLLPKHADMPPTHNSQYFYFNVIQ